MRKLVLFFVLGFLAACSQVTTSEARSIAYERLSAIPDGPSKHGDKLLASLHVTAQVDGKFLVEMRDEPRNLLWAVIVHKSGESEISRMAIDG